MKSLKDTLLIVFLFVLLITGFIIGGGLSPSLVVARLWHSQALITLSAMRAVACVGRFFGII